MAMFSAPLPPGGLFEIMFSFDTTGSMSRAIDEIKGRLQDMIQRLQADIPGIRIGLIAHGDYCDKDVFYLEKHVDLGTNVAELCDFVKEVDGTGGGDPEECYEYILHMIPEFSWTPGSQRALVLIADAAPHGPDYDLNVENLDWRKEAENLARMGIKVYGVQAFDNADSTAFFEDLVSITSGHHLQLGTFSNICDFIMAICYRERGDTFLEGYEAEVRAREERRGMNKDLEGLFGVLRRGDSSASNTSGVSRISTGSINSATKAISLVPGNVPLSKSSSILSVRSNSSAPGCSGVSPPVGIVLPNTATVIAAPRVTVKGKTGTKAKVTAKGTYNKGTRLVNKTKILPKHRHLIKDTKFILKQDKLKNRWSKWKLALSNIQPKSVKQWIKRNKSSKKSHHKLGWRRKQLFARESSNMRVLHEIAVQAKRGGKMHVVFCKWSTLNANPLTWEKRLLGQRKIQENVDNALKQDCKVFVRRFVPCRLGRNQKKSLRDFRHMYTYAWPDSTSISAAGQNNTVYF